MMTRERVLQSLLGLLGLLFTAGIYPLITALWQGHPSDYTDEMMLSLYVVLGVFLLLAIRNPRAHRSLIAFTGWSSLAHAAVMAVQSLQMGSERAELPALGVVAIVCGALLLLAPGRDRPESVWTAGGATAL